MSEPMTDEERRAYNLLNELLRHYGLPPIGSYATAELGSATIKRALDKAALSRIATALAEVRRETVEACRMRLVDLAMEVSQREEAEPAGIRAACRWNALDEAIGVIRALNTGQGGSGR